MSTTSPLVNDELTGLLSRRAFHDVFDSLLAKTKGSDALIALAFLDIDSFEHITFGSVISS